METGERYGRGVVLDPEVRVRRSGRAGPARCARLACDCGEIYTARIADLLAGKPPRSCGCYRRERAAELGRRRPPPSRAGARKTRKSSRAVRDGDAAPSRQSASLRPFHPLPVPRLAADAARARERAAAADTCAVYGLLRAGPDGRLRPAGVVRAPVTDDWICDGP